MRGSWWRETPRSPPSRHQGVGVGGSGILGRGRRRSAQRRHGNGGLGAGATWRAGPAGGRRGVGWAALRGPGRRRSVGGRAGERRRGPRAAGAEPGPPWAARVRVPARRRRANPASPSPSCRPARRASSAAASRAPSSAPRASPSWTATTASATSCRGSGAQPPPPPPPRTMRGEPAVAPAVPRGRGDKARAGQSMLPREGRLAGLRELRERGPRRAMGPGLYPLLPPPAAGGPG